MLDDFYLTLPPKNIFLIATTYAKHNLPIAPNLLDRQFEVEQPNQVYTSDITYIATDEGWLYLMVVIDLCSSAKVDEANMACVLVNPYLQR